MSKQHFHQKADTTFDALLQETVNDLPPTDQIVRAITPWRKNMNRVLVGLAFSTVIFNLFGLDYIFPGIGIILLLLGFRGLKNENPWFRRAWYVTIMRTIYFVFGVSIKSTLWRPPNALIYVSDAVSIVLILVLVFCFWQGLRTVNKKTGSKHPTTSGAALFVLFAIMGFVSQFPIDLSPILAPLALLCFLLILFNLVRLTWALDTYAYAMKSTPVHRSNWLPVVLYGVALFIGIASGYIFSNQHPMEWTPKEPTDHDELQVIITQLEDLGFPSQILKDLTKEDILACENALQVVVRSEDFPFNEGREILVGNVHTSVFDTKELRITQIAIQQPGDTGQWKIITHFHWLIHPGFYGTEAVQVLPNLRPQDSGQQIRNLSGRLLYSQDNTDYAAAYHYLENETSTSYNVFLGERNANAISAAFSLPKEGEQCRGYLSYDISPPPGETETDMIGTYITYMHQSSWMQFPVRSAYETLKSDDFTNFDPAFTKRQAFMSFDPDFPQETLFPEASQF